MNLKEAKEYFKKHPRNDLNGKYYAYDADGSVLGYVEYRKGVVVARKSIEKGKKSEEQKPERKLFQR